MLLLAAHDPGGFILARCEGERVIFRTFLLPKTALQLACQITVDARCSFRGKELWEICVPQAFFCLLTVKRSASLWEPFIQVKM